MKTNHFKVKTWKGFNLAIIKVKQIHYKRIEVFTKRFNPKSIATSIRNLLTRLRASSESTDSFSIMPLQHKHPHLWLWDSTQRFSNTNSPVCDSKTTLEGLDHQLLLIFKQQLQIYRSVLKIWEWYPVVTLIEEGTIPFRSHKSTSKVFQKLEKDS